MEFPTTAGALSPIGDYVPVLISCLGAVVEIDSAWSNPQDARDFYNDLVNTLGDAL